MKSLLLTLRAFAILISLLVGASAQAALVDTFTNVSALTWDTTNTAPSKTVNFSGTNTGVSFDITLATNTGNLMTGTYKPGGVSYLADSLGTNGTDWFEGTLTFTVNNFSGASLADITFQLVDVSGRKSSTNAILFTSSATPTTTTITLGPNNNDTPFSNIALDGSAADMAGGQYVATLPWKYYDSESAGLYKAFSFQLTKLPPSIGNYWAPAVGGGQGASSVHLTSTATRWATTAGTQGSGAQDPAGTLIFTDAAGTVVVDGTVTAGAGLTFSADGYTLSSGSASPNIRLAGASSVANTITTDSAVTAAIGVTLTGTNGLSKAGDGRLNLTAAPGYTGATNVNAGILSLAAAGLDNAADVKIKSGATMNLGFSGADTVGAVYLNDVVQDGGSYNATTAPGYFTGTGSLTVPVTARNFGVSGTWFGDWNVAANWGTSGFIPNGAGKWAVFPDTVSQGRMALTNSSITVGRLDLASTGPVAITGLQPNGTLTMQADPYLAGSTAAINVAGGVTHKINLPLTFASDTTITVADGSTLKLSDPVTVNAGKQVITGTTGSVVLESVLNVGAGGSFTVAAPLSEGMVWKQGAGALVLSANNTYATATTVDAGTLQIAAAGVVRGTGVSVNNDAQLAGSGTLVTDLLYHSSAHSTFSGKITEGAVELSGTGVGTLTLAGSNSYGDGTAVEAGRLEIAAADAFPRGGGLTIAGGGHVVLASGLSHAISLGGLTITSGAGTGSSPLSVDRSPSQPLAASQGAAAPTPEPGTLLLLAAGALAGLAAGRRRKTAN